jgi:hypothetical protein
MPLNLGRLAAIAFLSTSLGTAAAFARDERRGERIRGDDDPIIVPRSVAGEREGITSFDPETTGSIGKGGVRAQQDCDRFAFYPDRHSELPFQKAC